MLIEQIARHGLSVDRQAHRDLAPVLLIAMPGEEAVPLQSIQKSGNRGARDPGPFSQLVRRKPLWQIAQ